MYDSAQNPCPARFIINASEACTTFIEYQKFQEEITFSFMLTAVWRSTSRDNQKLHC